VTEEEVRRYISFYYAKEVRELDTMPGSLGTSLEVSTYRNPVILVWAKDPTMHLPYHALGRVGVQLKVIRSYANVQSVSSRSTPHQESGQKVDAQA
jgi:hypothetical protein